MKYLYLCALHASITLDHLCCWSLCALHCAAATVALLCRHLLSPKSKMAAVVAVFGRNNLPICLALIFLLILLTAEAGLRWRPQIWQENILNSSLTHTLKGVFWYYSIHLGGHLEGQQQTSNCLLCRLILDMVMGIINSPENEDEVSNKHALFGE